MSRRIGCARKMSKPRWTMSPDPTPVRIDLLFFGCALESYNQSNKARCARLDINRVSTHRIHCALDLSATSNPMDSELKIHTWCSCT